ncbi:hypothetical protein R3P38DRAFT_3266834 [Favolaschia claudopus]|uniref:Uncharacterized protein n=1 Tax=Favolaschia claudopus TaxID=2862362 RepID=A0AAW0BV24_9AGAR
MKVPGVGPGCGLGLDSIRHFKSSSLGINSGRIREQLASCFVSLDAPLILGCDVASPEAAAEDPASLRFRRHASSFRLYFLSTRWFIDLLETSLPHFPLLTYLLVTHTYTLLTPSSHPRPSPMIHALPCYRSPSRLHRYFPSFCFACIALCHLSAEKHRCQVPTLAIARVLALFAHPPCEPSFSTFSYRLSPRYPSGVASLTSCTFGLFQGVPHGLELTRLQLLRLAPFQLAFLDVQCASAPHRSCSHSVPPETDMYVGTLHLARALSLTTYYDCLLVRRSRPPARSSMHERFSTPAA